MRLHALFQFGKWTNYGKSHPKGKQFSPKRGLNQSSINQHLLTARGLCHVMVLGVKLRSLNFANKPGVKNYPRNGFMVSVTGALFTF